MKNLQKLLILWKFYALIDFEFDLFKIEIAQVSASSREFHGPNYHYTFANVNKHEINFLYVPIRCFTIVCQKFL